MTTLREELTNDPAGMGYAALLPACPGSVVDLLNAPTRQFVQSTFVTARTILAEFDDGAAILDALEAASSSVSAVKWAMVFLQQNSGLDVGNARTQSQLDGLAAAGVLTQEQASELKSLAMQSGSRAQEIGVGNVSEADVLAAIEGGS